MQSTILTADSIPQTEKLATVTTKRRWLRYGVRTLLVFVTLLCVWLGWLMHGVQKQRSAAARLEQYGAELVYFPFFTMPPWNDILPPSVRRGLNAALPSDDWRRLTSVEIENADFREEDLEILKDLPHLDHLRLPTTPLTDAGLRRIASLKAGKLILLDLMHTQITDDGLAELSQLKGLEWLFLGGNRITDAGLEQVAKLADLENLWLDDSQVTDAGIAHLRSLRKLDELSLDRTSVTGACLEDLAAMGSLRVLDLRETKVQGEGLAQLAALQKLELLILKDTPVSDADLPHLRQLSHVAVIWISGTNLSAEAIRQLPNARPVAAQPQNSQAIVDGD
jgi:Leucine-rich repeat (LRR) protein